MDRRSFLKTISLGAVGLVGAGTVGSLGYSAGFDSKTPLNLSKRLTNPTKPNIVFIGTRIVIMNRGQIEQVESVEQIKEYFRKLPGNLDKRLIAMQSE